MQSSDQWTPSWNALDLLDLESTKESWFNCVGTTFKGCRCGNRIAAHNEAAGKRLLHRLPLRSLDPETLDEDLLSIAGYLLCVRKDQKGRSHQNQATGLARMWRGIILVENETSKAEYLKARARKPRFKPKAKPASSAPKETQEPKHKTQPDHNESDDQDQHPGSNAYHGRSASEQEEDLRREQERRDEARRQSQRERFEQQHARREQEEQARARAEEEQDRSKRRQEDEAKRNRERESQSQESSNDWTTSWTEYHKRWDYVSKLPGNATVLDLEKVFPWPLKDIGNDGISKLDASFEGNVEIFFRHMPNAGQTSMKKSLRNELLLWHTDKLLTRFPVTAVTLSLKQLAKKITQVLTRLMGMVNV